MRTGVDWDPMQAVGEFMAIPLGGLLLLQDAIVVLAGWRWFVARPLGMPVLGFVPCLGLALAARALWPPRKPKADADRVAALIDGILWRGFLLFLLALLSLAS